MAVAAKQPHRAFAAPPGEEMLAAQLVFDIVEGFEGLDDRRRTVLARLLNVSAISSGALTFQRFGNAGASIQGFRPSIRSMFCTAAPEAPLPRLS